MVTYSRKRTGLILATRIDTLDELTDAGLQLVDFTQIHTETVVLSDDELYRLITTISLNSRTALLNLELFLSVRYRDVGYLNYLVPKLCNMEPLKPIFFVFYSNVLYEKFKTYYVLNKLTSKNFYED